MSVNTTMSSDFYDVQAIAGKIKKVRCKIDRAQSYHYLVYWKGYSQLKDATWEPFSNFNLHLQKWLQINYVRIPSFHIKKIRPVAPNLKLDDS